MFKKILIANDGSPGGMKALDVAITLAAFTEASLESISVEEGLPHYAGTIDEVVEVKQQKDAYFAELERRSQKYAQAAEVELTFTVIPGHKVQTIVDYVKEGHFDLLIIGFVRHSNVWGRLWGSTSQSLARLAPCSVLVVK